MAQQLSEQEIQRVTRQEDLLDTLADAEKLEIKLKWREYDLCSWVMAVLGHGRIKESPLETTGLERDIQKREIAVTRREDETCNREGGPDVDYNAHNDDGRVYPDRMMNTSDAGKPIRQVLARASGGHGIVHTVPCYTILLE